MTKQEAFNIFGIKVGASEDEIKKRYRELARKHHPDLNSGSKESEEKSKQINQAYDILTGKQSGDQEFDMFRSGGFNPFDVFNAHFGFGRMHENQARNAYDQYVNNVRRPIPAQNADLMIDVYINDLLDGKPIKTKSIKFTNCPHCEGLKVKLGTRMTCPVCNGAGMQTQQYGTTIGMTTTSFTCKRCRGVGKIFDTCNRCDQHGFVSEEVELDINMFNSNKILMEHKFTGLGFPSKNIGDNKWGDLNIKVRVIPNILKVDEYNGGWYLSNGTPVTVNFSDIINQNEIEVPFFDAVTKKIVIHKTKLPNNIILSNVEKIDNPDNFIFVHKDSLSFKFPVDNYGFEINGKQDKYLVNVSIDPVIK